MANNYFMECLFCNNNTDESKSVEHIIPESLGNIEHTLPRGLVCDGCNNYFSIKVEKVLLELPYFKNLRHRAQIKSKKGRVPNGKGIIISPNFPEVDIIFPKNGTPIISFQSYEDAYKLLNKKTSSLILAHVSDPDPNTPIVSRFLAKVAVEGLLYYLIDEDGWIDEILHHPDLVEIKQFARFGVGPSIWKYHQRRIYDEDMKYFDLRYSSEEYEILHQFRVLVTKEQHYYFVIVIMGIEYTIGYGGSEIDSYLNWLEENNHKTIIF